MNTINQIGNKLWEMANRLRGTMDASEYKNYILPFMFYRYLSDHQAQWVKDNHMGKFYDIKKDTNEMTSEEFEEFEDYLGLISNGLGYAITPKFTWDNMVNRIANHTIKASDFQDMIDSFNMNARRNESNDKRKYVEDFTNVFSDINLGDSRLGGDANARTKALNDIILMINEFNFKDESGRDILGDVYVYLLEKFAASAGKKGGEFYTPHEVSQVLAKLVTLDVPIKDDQFRVYDPTMGSGSLLLTVQKELPGGEREGSVEFYGQELNATTYNLARMNLMMHGVNYRNMHLKGADTLDQDWPFYEEGNIEHPEQFDAVVANPPYSYKWDIQHIDREKDPRFKLGVAPASKADYAFVLHGLHHLKADGTMAIVLPHGVLFRGASEGKIRQNIINENLLDAVIGLPANLFYGTSIPTCVLVFKGREARGENRDVLFIDASSEFEKAKNQNKLTTANIDKIIKTYRKRESVDKYAYVATLDEIKDNDYNLNIPRYVDTFEEEVVTPLPEIAKELQAVHQEIQTTSKELFNLLGGLEGTTDEAKKELAEFLKLMEQI